MKDNKINAVAAIDRDAIADIFAEIALEAAVAVMAVYAGDNRARRKLDGSPVCDADEAAEAIILKRLAMRLPHLPVLAEEAASRGEKMVAGQTFILVDPVDGTREFLSHNGEFTVNIGLIVDFGAACRRGLRSGVRTTLDRRRHRQYLRARARRGAAAA